MTVTKSPLRYPGGKAKLFPFVAKLISDHKLFSCVYREPYAGGAGLALNLLFSGFCRSIALNDLDPAIYSFWWSVVHKNDEFCKRVRNIVFSIEEWRRQKDIWSCPGSASEVDLGFATYYLNRTNRSGIIDGAGPIGGYDQTGPYKMDARFSMADQLSTLKQIGEASRFIEVTNVDALTYVDEHLREGEEVVYLDPPYYIKGQRLYRNAYSHEDHLAISRIMKGHNGYWIVSYDDVPEIRDMYRWAEPISLTLQYSAGPVVLGQEVVFLSDRFDASSIEQRAA